MDPETGCGLPSTGQKASLLIGAACLFWNCIGQILATALRPLAWFKRSSNDVPKRFTIKLMTVLNVPTTTPL